ncbi:MAG: hypothetical protein QME68_02650 [Elusimicrobiota bacterium]|nr:hypothetical protein [Elusimicrobiota bacterium]
MLGIKNFDYTLHKELLESFFKLAQVGKTLKGDTSGHLDGWGIGYYKNGEAVVHKSANSVIKEGKEFFEIVEKIVTSKVLIIHYQKIRLAWDKQSGKFAILLNMKIFCLHIMARFMTIKI